MSYSPVSELGKNAQSIGLVNNLNYQLQVLQRQVSTGKKSETFGGLGGAQAQLTLSLRDQLGALSNYQSTIANVKLRADTMGTALASIPVDASDILAKMKAVPQGGGNVPNLTILKDAANTMLQSVMTKLNTRVDGKYVFAGNQTATAPLADTSAALTNVDTILADYETGTPAATVITSLNGMTNANIGYASNIAAAGTVTARIDEGVTIDYTVKATESPFKDLITGLAMISQLDYSAAHAADFYTLFNNAMSRIDGASSSINTRNGQLGVTRRQLEDTSNTHGDTSGTVEANLAKAEDIDPAAAATKLSNLQTQIQAAYSLIAQLKGLSLVNYLN